VCTNATLGAGQWNANDGSGTTLVDALGYAAAPTLGTTYDITGPVTYFGGGYKLEPRSAGDVAWVADLAAPSVMAIGEMSDSTFLVQFSEEVEQSSSEVGGHYSIGGSSGTAAVRDPSVPSNVLVTIPNVAAGPRTLSITGVQDLYANGTAAALGSFTYIDTRIPAGYYNGTTGLSGAALRAALHNIIKNHTVKSYDYAYTAFQTSDVRPDGKVWDVYSDIPGGTPPYLYSFGQTVGSGNGEGAGYNREHSWPQAWFGSASPMYSDIWLLYPTDAKVNGYRGNLPYGVVGVPTLTSLNGTRVGPSADPDYVGTVFEPIDPYKGDLARSTCYVSTRYQGEDGGWPGSPAASGADLLPWAAHLYTEWSLADPVSQKERLRNGAIYVIQGNRNPFVDHPEWVAQIFDSSLVTAVGDAPVAGFALHQTAPNPFRSFAVIRFDLPGRDRVSLRIFDVAGRRVRTLAGGSLMDAGRHEATWDGRGETGALVSGGLYFYRLDAGPLSQTRRMVFLR
jgi:endonuclease I